MEFEEWRDAAINEWERIAPSYVQHDVAPLSGHLRELWSLGATVDMFTEALELAFASKAVTKRRALYYACGIVRRRMGES